MCVRWTTGVLDVGRVLEYMCALDDRCVGRRKGVRVYVCVGRRVLDVGRVLEYVCALDD
ncbi:hypothetical protein J6590_067434, partial [Homalodisca vitripennis]